MNYKCTECGNTLKKDLIKDLIIICPICETQYKVISASDGKQCLEEFTFDGSDPGEL